MSGDYTKNTVGVRCHADTKGIFFNILHNLKVLFAIT